MGYRKRVEGLALPCQTLGRRGAQAKLNPDGLGTQQQVGWSLLVGWSPFDAGTPNTLPRRDGNRATTRSGNDKTRKRGSRAHATRRTKTLTAPSHVLILRTHAREKKEAAPAEENSRCRQPPNLQFPAARQTQPSTQSNQQKHTVQHPHKKKKTYICRDPGVSANQ